MTDKKSNSFKSQRLTNAFRAKIIENALKAEFGEERAELQKTKDSLDAQWEYLVSTLREAVFTKEQIDLLDNAPDGYFPTSCDLLVRIELPNDRQKDKHLNLGKRVRIPYNSTAHLIKREHPWAVQYATWCEKFDQYRNELNILKEKERKSIKEISAILESCNTTGQLRQAWPEILELFPESSIGKDFLLPAVDVKGLNARLGIGKKDQ